MKIAKVVANPYAALAIEPSSDGESKVGIPQGVTALPASRGIWMGARLDPMKSERTGKNHFYFQPDKQSPELPRIVEIDVSDANVRGHIANAILDGSLIAADAKTASLVGIVGKEFLSVADCLKAEKAKSLDNLKASYGDACSLESIPFAEEKAAEDDGRPVAPARVKGQRLAANLTLQSDEGK
jgi:hypothetical protein